jgi:hypothetical protein
MMHTQTISRRTIKRVESQIQGLGNLRSVGNLGQFDLLSSTAMGPLKDLLDWITGRTGQLKVTATEFVEGMVKVMYGLEPGCSMPEPGIQIVAGANPPKFCAGSIAGMVERCRLSDAQTSLDTIQRQFTDRTARNSSGGWIYPEGEFVKRWMDEHWSNDKSNLTNAITTGRAICGIGGGGPVVTPSPIPGPGGTFTCPPNWRYNASMERCDYVLPGVQTGISSQTLMIIAGAAALFLFAMKR